MTTMITDVTFIVIALNEEKVINKCLDSISVLPVSDCQILCIDSGSRDNTLKIMMSYIDTIDNIEIFSINGTANASIARNAGIAASTRKYIFFIDGDTEINGRFITEAIALMNSNKFSAVRGNLKEFQYDTNYHVLRKTTDRSAYTDYKVIYLSGGTFIARRDSVVQTGLFDETLRKTQDYDFTLRLTKHHRMVSISTLMGTHHTIPYLSRKDGWTQLLYSGYYNGGVIRKNIRHLKGIFFWFKSHKGLVTGIIIYTLLLISIMNQQKMMISILVAFFILDILAGVAHGLNNTMNRVITHFIQPFFFIYGFIIRPGRKPSYTVKRIYPL